MEHLRTRSAFKRIRDNAVYGMVLHPACLLPSKEIYLRPTVRYACLRFCTAGVDDGGGQSTNHPADAGPAVPAAECPCDGHNDFIHLICIHDAEWRRLIDQQGPRQDGISQDRQQHHAVSGSVSFDGGNLHRRSMGKRFVGKILGMGS